MTSISSQISPRPPQKLALSPKQSMADIIKERQEIKKQILKQTGTLGSSNEFNQFSKSGSTNQSVTFKEPESDIFPINNRKNEQKMTENNQEVLRENKNLRFKIEILQKQAMEREAKFKQESDLMIIKLHENLSKDMKSETDKQELIKLLLPKQQESNERLMNEQAVLIESLSSKCKRLENELKILKEESDGIFVTWNKI